MPPSSTSPNSSPRPPSSTTSSNNKPDKIDPILRNAIRYTISQREYTLLHQYLLSRVPAVKKRTPPPKRLDAIAVKSRDDDYNAAAIRASLRLAVATFTGCKVWEWITARRAGMASTRERRPIPPWKSANVRLTCSLSLILLFHRLLRRFLLRLGESLLSSDAKPFRRRNPRISRTLTSRLAPALGSSLAGFFLAVAPKAQLRVTMAIYLLTSALEYYYNHLESLGCFVNLPSWFGSWMLMPVSAGQLLHAFAFDRDCFPTAFGKFILDNSPEYIQVRPPDYPTTSPWPGRYEIADSLAQISKLRWPAFTSPILFPSQSNTLPSKSLISISPITSPAHPTITHLSCALLHPNDPSCLRTYLTYWLRAFPKITRFVTLLLSALSLPRYKVFLDNPLAALNVLAKRILRLSLFLAGSIGTSWASICLFQSTLSRDFLATQRWFLGGFLGGLWAFVDREAGRANFVASTRYSVDSLWKVGVKRGWWRGVKNGDVLLFVASLAVVNSLYEVDPGCIKSAGVRKGLGFLRGEGWVDRGVLAGVSGKGKERAEREAKKE